MNQEELVKLQKKLKESMLSTWKLFLEVDKIINSSLQDKTPKVITNEKQRNLCVCQKRSDTCYIDDIYTCWDCELPIA